MSVAEQSDRLEQICSLSLLIRKDYQGTQGAIPSSDAR